MDRGDKRCLKIVQLLRIHQMEFSGSSLRESHRIVETDCVFPAFPILVLTMITPFAAREPYNPVAATSFNTVMLSTSTGL